MYWKDPRLLLANDNEIEEYTPVKTEPRDPLPHPIPVQSVPASFHSQDEFQTQDTEMVEEAGNDQGTVALDESYAVDEGYDYQNAGDSYTDQTQTPKIDTNKGNVLELQSFYVV